MTYESISTNIISLGEAQFTSPLQSKYTQNEDLGFVSDSKRIVIDVDVDNLIFETGNNLVPKSFELSGPRKKVYFHKDSLTCAIVTCGGLCPGLNDIIRAIVLELFYSYGVNNVLGIRYGLRGLVAEHKLDPLHLTPDSVKNILDIGGSVLGSSRGSQDFDLVVDNLQNMGVGILFMIGGDGTLKASTKIADVINKRNLKISVIGIPKTIDNDIYLVSRSFGFDTAVDVASQAIIGAHSEAEGYPNGIGLLKLMGRHSGYIAATAALARQDVNFVLVPEVDFELYGSNGFLASLAKRILDRKHAVVVVAEGAGQDLFEGIDSEKDASGNVKLFDIGLFLKDKISSYFAEQKINLSLKYIDPSYMIRSLPANASDRVFCGLLGRDAVHAGMAGKTRLLIGHWNNQFIHIPMDASVGKRKRLKEGGKLWRSVVSVTGQKKMVTGLK